MLGRIKTATTYGIHGMIVDVEVDIARGLPSFTTVGLPETAVRESKDRVKAAINNSGYEFPNRKITVNLAPADLKKSGTGYDLPIAIGILSNHPFKEQKLQDTLMIGELSLDGGIRPVKGILSVVIAAKEAGLGSVILPAENIQEASLVQDIDLFGVTNLAEVVDHLADEKELAVLRDRAVEPIMEDQDCGCDFQQVKGQFQAKRALEIAVAGHHNILMDGPPGAGKTMLARCLPSIMPSMSFDEILETTKIYSVAGMLNDASGPVMVRPFRAPHHTISDVGLIGGGQIPKPGEISLAHNGVLFLDEIAEFPRSVLEVMRQPLESGSITISRASGAMDFPARFLLVAAMNPCPCGFLGDEKNSCTCNPNQVQRYRNRLSGPLLDRIDIHIEVPAVSYDDLKNEGNTAESSAMIKERVLEARTVQAKRFARRKKVAWNSHMDAKQIDHYCKLDEPGHRLLKNAYERFGISARAFHRIKKIARTIADLAGSENITSEHLAEAIQYRRLDRKQV